MCVAHPVDAAPGPARTASSPGPLSSGALQTVEREGDTWTLRSYAAVRAVLRARDAVTQAGFNAELATRTGLRPPVPFEDGSAHREHRVAIARRFTPSTIDAEYRERMDTLSDALLTTNAHVLRFYLFDVRPAIRARRKQPGPMSSATCSSAATRTPRCSSSASPTARPAWPPPASSW